ncbi:MAG: Gfo/Idh/MocA family oxidoreductase [Nitrospiraceae bacterium]|nr:Gfo/Idh/MocA family oxidoreductase [Nitrospiraceae bacterium]
MSDKARVAVIGCGQIAKHLHVPDYAFCPQAEIVALCDVIPAKAKALAAQRAPEAKIYTDYKKLLREVKPDAVTVATPNYLHAPITIAALKAGCHVNVEKPMACSLAEAKRMLETAKKCKKLLNVNQSQRLFPPHVKAKEVIDSGIMGKILHLTAMFGHPGPESWSPTGKWFFKKKEARFGAMADLGVHKADLVRYLTGKEVAQVTGFFERLEKKRTDVEDNFVAALKFTDGTVGTLAASWTVKGMEANYLILHCVNGTLRIGELPGQPLVANLVNPECEIVFEVPEPATNEDESWGLDASGRFIRATLDLEEPYCPGEEGMKSLNVILAAEKSALTGKTVKL